MYLFGPEITFRGQPHAHSSFYSMRFSSPEPKPSICSDKILLVLARGPLADFVVALYKIFLHPDYLHLRLYRFLQRPPGARAFEGTTT